jgi:acetyltransferase-like isoleucine patch superfamily enzyme
MPVFRPLAALLFAERDMRDMLWPMFLKIVYREPLMRYRCGHVGTGLELEGAMPWIEGSGSIRIGDNVRIGGRNSWTIGYKHAPDAELVIGDRVNVGFQTTIGAAKSVRIGDDTIMAPGVVIFDNPTHPLEPGARLRHETFDIDEARPVEIGRNVWVATGAMIMRGVRIGDGAVVAAGSVVTRDVPAATLVAGNPARVIKAVTAGDREPPSA